MTKASPLVPMTKQDEDVHDEVLASLSQLAYSSATIKPKVRKKRHSRFFFRINPSFAQEVKAKKQSVLPKKLQPIDSEVDNRVATYKKELPAELSGNIDAVREFFLRDIGPLSLATSAGATQAMEVVKRLLNTDVDSTQFEKFERMSHAAVNLKMARFIARYYKLPKREAQRIIDAIAPKQPTFIPIPTPSSPQPDRVPRHERNKQAQQRREEGKESQKD